MKVLSAVVGGVIGAILGVVFLANMGAQWYTAQSEFQSPTEFEETYGTIYLAVIVGCTILGYIIGRIIGARVERNSAGSDTSLS